jgi:hypothetical protein
LEKESLEKGKRVKELKTKGMQMGLRERTLVIKEKKLILREQALIIREKEVETITKMQKEELDIQRKLLDARQAS